MKYIYILLIGILITVLFACSENHEPDKSNQMDSIAEDYVKLVLNIGLYDPIYIDSYFGPKEWLPSMADKQDTFPYTQFNNEIVRLIELNNEIDTSELVGLEKQRHTFLTTQLKSVQAKIEMLNGRQYSLDEEFELLYDAVPLIHSESYYQEMISKLENLVPGSGNLSERLDSFLKDFVIPEDRLDTVFNTAIVECRKQTLKYIELPNDENLKLEFVTGKPWRMYSYYKGNSISLIQVNTDLPLTIYKAIGTGAHEGYPGHHVYSTLVDQHFVKDRGWKEYCVLPIHSPRALMVEGTAVFAQELVMPIGERIAFERKVLFPLAKLDANKIETYYQIREIQFELDKALNEVARNYLDGKFTEEEALNWLMKYGLLSPELAQQKLNFIKKYRSYVLNYLLGYNIVKKYIELNGGTADNIEKRWELFTYLITTPLTPSELIEATNENFQ